ELRAGGAQALPFASVPNVARVLGWLREYGVRIVGTSDAARESLFEADLGGPLAFVMGEEHRGLRRSVQERCDILVRLPMHGTVQSLNLSVACGICRYGAGRQGAAAAAAPG